MCRLRFIVLFVVISYDNVEFSAAENQFGANANKCCGPNQTAYVEELNVTCKPQPSPVEDNDHPFLKDKNILYNKLCDKEIYFHLSEDVMQSAIVANSDGSITLSGSDSVSQDNYCFDFDEDTSPFVRICNYTPKDDTNWTHLIAMSVSCVFLSITLIVYALYPNKTIHNKAMMCYVSGLLVAYALLILTNTYDDLGESCKAVGYVTLFFFLVSFFWMNVICFDIFLTFFKREYASSPRLRARKQKKKLIFYCVYAYGLPAAICLIVMSVQTYYDEANLESEFNPKIGEGACFLRGDGYAYALYFYGEIATLIAVNTILFIITACKIFQVRRETNSAIKKHEQCFQKDKAKFFLYCKLLVAMGLNWSMEIVDWIIKREDPNSEHNVVRLTCDFFNASYGIFIFFIFVFKKSTWRMLKKRLGCLSRYQETKTNDEIITDELE